MSGGQLEAVVRRLVGVATLPANDQSDCQLLNRFIETKDEAAFASLLRRHGPLVLGVCRAVLHQDQDAEDAFQATFLVLARMAASIRKHNSLASWLHGVAVRTALKARQAMKKRRQKEQQAGTRSAAEPVSEAALRELQAIVNEEIGRLADKYRAPFVLCCVLGKSRAEAAQDLGWKEGTVSSRIAQARTLLEAGLTRRGITLPTALTVALLAPEIVSASVPAALAASLVVAAGPFAAGECAATVSAQAVRLAERVIRALWFTRNKTVTALVVALMLLCSGWAVAYSLLRVPDHDPLPAVAWANNGDRAPRPADDLAASQKALPKPAEQPKAQPQNERIARLIHSLKEPGNKVRFEGKLLPGGEMLAFSDPMCDLISIGEPARALLHERINDSAIQNEVVLILGAIGDRTTVPLLIDVYPEKDVREAPPSDRDLLKVICVTYALTYLTAQPIGRSRWGADLNPKNKMLWQQWWQKNHDTFVVAAEKPNFTWVPYYP